MVRERRRVAIVMSAVMLLLAISPATAAAPDRPSASTDLTATTALLEWTQDLPGVSGTEVGMELADIQEAIEHG